MKQEASTVYVLQFVICFKEQLLTLLLIFLEVSFFGGMRPWTPVYLLWIHSLIWMEQFKQKTEKFWLVIIFCWHWLWTVWEDGRWDQIGCIRTPGTNLSLGFEIKKILLKNTFQVSIIKAKYAKNVSERHFPTECNGVTD